MRFAPHSRRFDPRWLFPGTETDGEEASDAPDVCPFSSDDVLTSAVTERDLDLGSNRSLWKDAACVLSAGRS